MNRDNSKVKTFTVTVVYDATKTDEEQLAQALEVTLKGATSDARMVADLGEVEVWDVSPLDKSVSVAKRDPADDIGDVMTLEQFLGAAESGAFIDYDGYGHLANMGAAGTGLHESNIEVRPSDRLRLEYIRQATHVVWFNR